MAYDKPRGPSRGPARGPKREGGFGGKREGGFDRKPREGGFGGRDGGERRPYAPREGGERRPYASREGGERRPYAPREGGFGGREGGERRPYAPREGGERRPYAPREGGFDRKPREGGFGGREGGERRPYAPREGGFDRKPREGGFGGREGGERRPYAPREGGERRPYAPREGGYERKPYGQRDSGGFERKPRFSRDDKPRFEKRENTWENNDGERPQKRRQVEFMHPQEDGWLVGPHAVKSALKAGRRVAKMLWVQNTPEGELAELIAKYPNLEVETKERSAFDDHFGDLVHQGIALSVGNLPQPELDEVLGEKPQVIVALDQVTDPHNVGAILRSCAAFGVGAVLMPDRRNASVTPVVAKSAAGGLEVVPVVEIGNMAQTLKQVKEAGYTVLGLAGEGTLGLDNVTVEGPICVVLGSEGDGLRRLTREMCDHLVRIPQDMGAVGSLNVSVATGIALYALTR